MFRWLCNLVLLSFALSGSCFAQSPTPATDSTAQNQPAPSSTTDSAAKNPPPKKVWTNENLSQSGGKVSVIGDTRNQKYTMTPAKPADPATISRIRESLDKLQGQLENVNKQLTAFREFQEGEPVVKGSEDAQKGYSRMPVNQQMTVLQEKRKKLETQIDALFDEARKKGIDPGQLR